MAITWSPTDKNSAVALSGGNLVASANATSWKMVRATSGASTKNLYFEMQVTAGNNCMMGLAKAAAALNNYIGVDSNSWGIQIGGTAIYKRYSGTYSTISGVSAAVGDVYRFAWNSENGALWAGKNNVWLESGNPETGANPLFTGIAGTFFPACCPYSASDSILAKFLAQDQIYTAPAGFLSYEYFTVEISSNLTVQGNGAGDYVAILDATTKELVTLIETDTNGDWADSIPEGVYYAIYFGGLLSDISGPHTISTSGVSPPLSAVVLGSGSGSGAAKTIGYPF